MADLPDPGLAERVVLDLINGFAFETTCYGVGLVLATGQAYTRPAHHKKGTKPRRTRQTITEVKAKLGHAAIPAPGNCSHAEKLPAEPGAESGHHA